MRLRTLKPGFFKNEDLLELSPLARLLFAGMWCLADREGRFEDRPKRIKHELLPADDCDGEQLFDQLAARGFILRYEVRGERYVQIVNFKKHQTPHQKERASTIPGPAQPSAKPGLAPDMPDANPMQTQVKHPPVFRAPGLPGSRSSGEALTEPLSETSKDGDGERPPSPGEVGRTTEPTATAVAPTETLQEFHGILSRFPEYQPSAEFYRKVAEKYGALDLVEEALKIADWLPTPGARKKHRTCTTRFVLDWLHRSLERTQEVANGVHRIGPARGDSAAGRRTGTGGRTAVGPDKFAGYSVAVELES